jgi:Rrf2 family protein
MLLTRAADYAVRVMIQMAKLPEGQRTSLPELATATHAPHSFLSKVLQTLSKAGMVRSWRGNDGGFEILSPGRKATLREVVEAVDGPLFLNVCLTSGDSCALEQLCPAHEVWVRAQMAVMNILDGVSVTQMSAGHEPPQSSKLQQIREMLPREENS